MRTARFIALAVALAGVLAVAPSSASAAVTFGSNLGDPPNQTANCGMTQCTFAQNALIGVKTAPAASPHRCWACWSASG